MNVVTSSSNKMLNKYHQSQHQRCKVFDQVPDSDWNAYLRNLQYLHYMLLLTISQETTDEKLHKEYLSLSQGRLSVPQILAPLRHVTFFEYHKAISHRLKHAGGHMYNKKAESYLSLACILASKYDSTLPMETISLLGIPEIGIKKVAVVLLACGLYNKIGLGPGSDTHVIKFIASLIKGMCDAVDIGDTTIKSMVEEVAQYLPLDPGIYIK